MIFCALPLASRCRCCLLSLLPTSVASLKGSQALLHLLPQLIVRWSKGCLASRWSFGGFVLCFKIIFFVEFSREAMHRFNIKIIITNTFFLWSKVLFIWPIDCIYSVGNDHLRVMMALRLGAYESSWYINYVAILFFWG